MAHIEDLYNVYNSFCQFGSSKNLAGPTTCAEPLMDGSKFAKFARDTKVVDKTITSTDIDIFFNKVKKRDGRKLDFKSFQDALKLVAQKRSPKLQPTEAYSSLVKFVCSKPGPKSSGTVPKGGDIVSRLTDTSKYTGTHKHRFDDDGKGRGIAGRSQPNLTADLSQITNRQAATVSGVPLAAALQAGVLPSTLVKSGSVKRNIDLAKSKDSLYSKKK